MGQSRDANAPIHSSGHNRTICYSQTYTCSSTPTSSTTTSISTFSTTTSISTFTNAHTFKGPQPYNMLHMQTHTKPCCLVQNIALHQATRSTFCILIFTCPSISTPTTIYLRICIHITQNALQKILHECWIGWILSEYQTLSVHLFSSLSSFLKNSTQCQNNGSGNFLLHLYFGGLLVQKSN